MPNQNVVRLFTSQNPSALVDRRDLTESVALLAKPCSGRRPLLLTYIRFSSETE